MNQVKNSDGTTDSYHILNGDCLEIQLKQTKINSKLIIFRECLIEGPLTAFSTDSFLDMRAEFIAGTFNISVADYFRKSAEEIRKIETIPENAEVYLWFENDLFCQVNMWFVISLLSGRSDLKLYRVFPKKEQEEHWTGFGTADSAELEQCFNEKVRFSPDDIKSGSDLWSAYQKENPEKLIKLSEHPSDCFKYLPEVCRAHCDRFPQDGSLGKPERLVLELIRTHSKDFPEVFSEFSKRAGIYGFADTQIRRIYDRFIGQERNNY